MSELSGNSAELARQKAIRARCVHPDDTSSREGESERIRKAETKHGEQFEEQVAKYGDRIAVKDESAELTFDELNKRANRIARAILEQHGESQQPVALLLQQGIPAFSGILGTLKSGKTYMPMASWSPRVRNDYILRDSQASLIVTDSMNLPLARELAQDKIQLLNINELDAGLSVENLNLAIQPDYVRQILYTSGSTGQPKGVFRKRSNPSERMGGFSIDMSLCIHDRVATFGLWSNMFLYVLLKGASFHYLDIREKGVAGLADWLIKEEITVCKSVVTAFRHFVDTLTGEETFPRLRLIYLESEPVYRRDVELYKRYFSPDCILINQMGITEVGSICRYFIDKNTQIDGNLVPVGYPIGDKEILLLDEHGKEVGPNQVGEIAVKDDYRYRGYWGKPDLTKAKFLPDPEGGDKHIYLSGDLGRMSPDGRLTHLGRKDSQLKIRGHRIEVAEIEMAMLKLDVIKEVVVVAREDSYGDQSLVAYLVPVEGTDPKVRTLRRALAEVLPDYMIPSAFVMMDALPLTPGGKIDRLALPDPEVAGLELGVDFVAPRDELETRLMEIWKEVLSIDSIGVQDGFLELGGNSILAARLFTQIQKISGQELGLSAILRLSTIEKQANLIRQIQSASAYPLLIAIQTDGARIPLFAVHACNGEVLFYRDLAHHLGPEQPFYALRLHGIHGKEVPHDTVEDMAEQYVREIQVIQPEGPYLLCGLGVGGRIAFEMAQQLVSQEKEIGLLALMDSAPPDHTTLDSGPSILDSGPSIHRRSVGYYSHRLLYHLWHGQLLHVLMARTKKIGIKAKEIRIKAKDWITLNPQERRMKDASETLMRVAGAYAPQVYPGRIVYFSSNARDDRSPLDIWHELARDGLDVQEVPGYHGKMLREPHVQVLAEQLKAYLGEAQKAGGY